jgi:hypothetical protein
MTEALHILGICPDSYQHISILKALMIGYQELNLIYIKLEIQKLIRIFQVY